MPVFSRSNPLALVVIGSLTIAACGGTEATTSAADPPSTETTEESMTDESMTDESSSGTTEMADDEMADDEMTDDEMTDEAAAPWQTLPITDIDGETFTLAELTGTPVIVELFATWCPNCRAQLEVTNAAARSLGDEAVVVALSVETDLDSGAVADYAEDNGFDSIRFAVLSPELLAAVVEDFGPTAANPPSTPKFVIDAMGHAGDLTTGPESADDLIAAVGGEG